MAPGKRSEVCQSATYPQVDKHLRHWGYKPYLPLPTRNFIQKRCLRAQSCSDTMNGRGTLNPSKTDDTFAPRRLIRVVDRAFWLASCSPDDDGTADLSERTRSDPRRIRIIYLYFLFNKLAKCVNDSKSKPLCAREEKEKNWRCGDSNPGHLAHSRLKFACEASALPLSYIPIRYSAF